MYCSILCQIELGPYICTCVNVPVLSEKTYCICPSSSFNVVVLALAGVSDVSSYISISQLIIKLCARRIHSTLEYTKYEINMKVLSRTKLHNFRDSTINVPSLPHVKWYRHNSIKYYRIWEKYQKRYHSCSSEFVLWNLYFPFQIGLKKFHKQIILSISKCNEIYRSLKAT